MDKNSNHNFIAATSKSLLDYAVPRTETLSAQSIENKIPLLNLCHQSAITVEFDYFKKSDLALALHSKNKPTDPFPKLAYKFLHHKDGRVIYIAFLKRICHNQD